MVGKRQPMGNFTTFPFGQAIISAGGTFRQARLTAAAGRFNKSQKKLEAGARDMLD